MCFQQEPSLGAPKRRILLKLSGMSTFREQTKKLKFKCRPCGRPNSTATFQGSTSAILWCGEAHPLTVALSSSSITVRITNRWYHSRASSHSRYGNNFINRWTLSDRVHLLQYCKVNSSAPSVVGFYLLNCQSIGNKRAYLNQ